VDQVVTNAALIWSDLLADFDLGEGHPMDPLRLLLTYDLMRAYGLIGIEGSPVDIVEPRPATAAELAAVHARGYIEAVQESSDWGGGHYRGLGLGTEDNPIYPGMHDIAALTAGASLVALEEVVSGRRPHTFSVAGGMHHAHRGRASGFSVYNDASVAIVNARLLHPGIDVLYIDLDAHHGDGVQSTFAGSADVMTISIHQSGLYAFPGTGFPIESGYGAGAGLTVNVPMPKGATDKCFELVYGEVVRPLAASFRPDVIVAQLGADAHYSDPQTELGLTIPGYRSLVSSTIELAEKHCGGRLAALGGGGYSHVDIVPRAWTWVMAELAGVTLDEALPEEWRSNVAETLDEVAPLTLGADDVGPQADESRLLAETEQVINEVRSAVFPHHGLT
jgi:acetoin utilization protein AcuC